MAAAASCCADEPAVRPAAESSLSSLSVESVVVEFWESGGGDGEGMEMVPVHSPPSKGQHIRSRHGAEVQVQVQLR